MRPPYHLLQLLTLTTSPGAEASSRSSQRRARCVKLLTAYVSPQAVVTILGLHTAGGKSRRPRTHRWRTASAGARHRHAVRLLSWNGDGSGTEPGHRDFSWTPGSRARSNSRSWLADAVFALTSTPIGSSPWRGRIHEPRQARLSRAELLRRAGVAVPRPPFSGGSARIRVRRPSEVQGPLAQGRALDRPVDATSCHSTTPGSRGDVGEDLGVSRTNVQVDVDRVSSTATGAGRDRGEEHGAATDIFGLSGSSVAYGYQVIDHSGDHRRGRARGRTVRRRWGEEQCTTRREARYFGVADNVRARFSLSSGADDLWNEIGESPATWDHVRRAAPKSRRSASHRDRAVEELRLERLPDRVHDVASARSSGTSANVLTIDSRNTIRAVQFMADLSRSGRARRSSSGESASNNPALFAGKSSTIVTGSRRSGAQRRA